MIVSAECFRRGGNREANYACMMELLMFKCVPTANPVFKRSLRLMSVIVSAVAMGESRVTNNSCLHSRLGEFHPAIALTVSGLSVMA